MQRIDEIYTLYQQQHMMLCMAPYPQPSLAAASTGPLGLAQTPQQLVLHWVLQKHAVAVTSGLCCCQGPVLLHRGKQSWSHEMYQDMHLACQNQYVGQYVYGG
jgi:hypothetical protein